MPAEYWDLFHKDGCFARVIQKGEKIPLDMYHMAVEVIPMDGAGHLLCMRRSMFKKYSGGYYEFPAGSVLSGETPEQAAARELLEETGLTANNLFRIDESLTTGLKRIYFIAYIPDLTAKTILLQEEETISYKFVTVQQWMGMIRDASFDLNRCKMYTEQVYRYIDLLTGEAPTEANANKKKELHPCSLLGDEQATPAKELPQIDEPLDDELMERGI